MRELVLDRINEIRTREQNFSRSAMRWRDYKIQDIHISKFDYSTLSDAELLREYERLIRRMSIVM